MLRQYVFLRILRIGANTPTCFKKWLWLVRKSLLLNELLLLVSKDVTAGVDRTQCELILVCFNGGYTGSNAVENHLNCVAATRFFHYIAFMYLNGSNAYE